MTVKIDLFYSPTCLYCPEARKIVLEIAEEFSGKVRVEEINILSSTGTEKLEKYSVKGVPTIVINSKTKITGIPTTSQLREAVLRELDRKEVSS